MSSNIGPKELAKYICHILLIERPKWSGVGRYINRVLSFSAHNKGNYNTCNSKTLSVYFYLIYNKFGIDHQKYHWHNQVHIFILHCPGTCFPTSVSLTVQMKPSPVITLL
jgi:hypothetical protein